MTHFLKLLNYKLPDVVVGSVTVVGGAVVVGTTVGVPVVACVVATAVATVADEERIIILYNILTTICLKLENVYNSIVCETMITVNPLIVTTI